MLAAAAFFREHDAPDRADMCERLGKSLLERARAHHPDERGPGTRSAADQLERIRRQIRELGDALERLQRQVDGIDR